LVESPNFDILKNLILDKEILLNKAFQNLINELNQYLNLEIVNKKYEIQCVKNIEKLKKNEDLFKYGIAWFIEGDIYFVKLNKNYHRFFPFLLLLAAYFAYVPDNLKKSNLVEFAINQFVEIDLEEFELIDEWKLLSRDKYIRHKLIFRFEKFLDLKRDKPSENPLSSFFKYIRRYSNLNLDENPDYHLQKIYDEYLIRPSFRISSNEMVETLRILTQIFYRVKNIDTLAGYFSHFKSFKERGIIKTELSYRKFRRNLRRINKSGYIAPSYYYDWKAMDMAIIVCYLKFNPQLDKTKIDKIIYNLPFFIMPRVSNANFSLELTGFFVIPRVYIKDLLYMIEKMERSNYIISKHCSMARDYSILVNLNYFLDSYKHGQILNIKNKNYSKSYELVFTLTYNQEFNKICLTLLDFLILERIRYFSYLGVTFSRRREISNIIKSDFYDYIIAENNLIENLEESFKKLMNFPNLRNHFKNFLERNQKFGFFYLKGELDKWKTYFNIIEQKSDLFDIFEFKEFIEKETIIHVIEESGIFNEVDLKSYGFKSLFSDYLNSNEKFLREVKELEFFSNFLELCSHLKIFDIMIILKIVTEPVLLKGIIKLKKQRLEDSKEKTILTNLSYKTINRKIDKFLFEEPQLIKPYLIATIIPRMAVYFPQIILKSTSEVKKNLENLRRYFPRSYYYETEDLFGNQKFIYVQLSTMYLTKNEKIILISVFYQLFGKNIISFKRYPWSGLLETFSRMEFYDFNKTAFFYTPDLFEQYNLYTKKVLGEDIPPFIDQSVTEAKIWPNNKNITNLIEEVNKRVRSENIKFNLDDLQKLAQFHLNLDRYFLHKNKYETLRKEKFFKEYIRSIKVMPAFHRFGLAQYILYISPFNFKDIDYRLLFTNTFQKIKLNASIDTSFSFFIKFIFPYFDPNTSYLNWLRCQNKLREYCFFKVESVFQIIHFHGNLSSDGWQLDSNNFKQYIQNILFNPDDKSQTIKARKFSFINLKNSKNYNPESKQYKSLLEVYNWHSFDIRKKIPFLNNSTFDQIKFIIEDEVAYPYLTFKNLGFKEKIYFFLINIKKETINSLRNVFQYFNFAFLYEITGEYYIHGFDDKKQIINGLMIKLYLPECELADFLRIFEYIFQFLKIEKYLILPDLVNGEHFVKRIYGDNKIYENYNPLTNLIWDPKKKIWKNHKLFGPRFEYLYPDLYYTQKEEI